MPTRYDSSGKIQPTEFRNLLAPAECLMCKRIGRQSDEIFANLGVELEFYGMCYLCQDCCHEVANFVMCVPPEQHDHLKDEYLVLQANNHGLTKKVEYLKGLLDARIDSAGSSESDSDGDASVSLFEVDDAADEIDRILKSEQSKSA